MAFGKDVLWNTEFSVQTVVQSSVWPWVLVRPTHVRSSLRTKTLSLPSLAHHVCPCLRRGVSVLLSPAAFDVQCPFDFPLCCTSLEDLGHLRQCLKAPRQGFLDPLWGFSCLTLSRSLEWWEHCAIQLCALCLMSLPLPGLWVTLLSFLCLGCC